MPTAKDGFLTYALFPACPVEPMVPYVLSIWMQLARTDWLAGWLTDWLAGWLADWLTDWLTGWLADTAYLRSCRHGYGHVETVLDTWYWRVIALFISCSMIVSSGSVLWNSLPASLILPSVRLCCLMSSDVGWHFRDKLRPMRELYVHRIHKAR